MGAPHTSPGKASNIPRVHEVLPATPDLEPSLNTQELVKEDLHTLHAQGAQPTLCGPQSPAVITSSSRFYDSNSPEGKRKQKKQ